MDDVWRHDITITVTTPPGSPDHLWEFMLSGGTFVSEGALTEPREPDWHIDASTENGLRSELDPSSNSTSVAVTEAGRAHIRDALQLIEVLHRARALDDDLKALLRMTADRVIGTQTKG